MRVFDREQKFDENDTHTKVIRHHHHGRPKRGTWPSTKKKKNFTSQSIWQKIERMTLLFRFDAYNSHILVNKKERERDGQGERESFSKEWSTTVGLYPPPHSFSPTDGTVPVLHPILFCPSLFIFKNPNDHHGWGEGASHRRIKWHEYFRPSADFWIRVLFHRFSSKERQKCVEFLGCS